jgi:hypothetical protein
VDVLSSRILVWPGDRDRSLLSHRDVSGLAVYREFSSPDHPVSVFFLGQGLLEVSVQGATGRAGCRWGRLLFAAGFADGAAGDGAVECQTLLLASVCGDRGEQGTGATAAKYPENIGK